MQNITHLSDIRGRYSITTSISLCDRELHNSSIVKSNATCKHCSEVEAIQASRLKRELILK